MYFIRIAHVIVRARMFGHVYVCAHRVRLIVRTVLKTILRPKEVELAVGTTHTSQPTIKLKLPHLLGPVVDKKKEEKCTSVEKLHCYVILRLYIYIYIILHILYIHTFFKPNIHTILIYNTYVPSLFFTLDLLPTQTYTHPNKRLKDVPAWIYDNIRVKT